VECKVKVGYKDNVRKVRNCEWKGGGQSEKDARAEGEQEYKKPQRTTGSRLLDRKKG
jgi:hypothetical protein